MRNDVTTWRRRCKARVVRHCRVALGQINLANALCIAYYSNKGGGYESAALFKTEVLRSTMLLWDLYNMSIATFFLRFFLF